MENQLNVQLARDAVKYGFILCSAEGRALVEEIDRLTHELSQALMANIGLARINGLYQAALLEIRDGRKGCYAPDAQYIARQALDPEGRASDSASPPLG
jgi:hypothetical protein